MLVDRAGEPVVSPIVESIQLRRYLRIPRDVNDGPLFRDTQQFSEFRLSQRALLEARPSLRRIGEDENGFVTFHSHGLDAFESSSEETGVSQRPRFSPTTPMLICAGCHQGIGVNSFTSYSRMQFADSKDLFVMVHASDEATESQTAVSEVKAQPLWERLQVLMNLARYTAP